MGTVAILNFPRILVVDTARTARIQGIYAVDTDGAIPSPTSANALKVGMESNALKLLVLWTILSLQNPVLSPKPGGKRWSARTWANATARLGRACVSLDSAGRHATVWRAPICATIGANASRIG